MTTITTKETDGESTMIKPRRIRIACCAPPQSGHLNPIMSLAESLVERNKTKNDENGDGDQNYAENEVCVLTLVYGAKKVSSRCDAHGIKLVGLDLGEGYASDKALKVTANGEKRQVFVSLADAAKTQVEEALDKFRPDVVVCDMVGFAAQEYAASRNIPLVINCPFNFVILRAFLKPVINADDDHYLFSYGGLFVSYTRISLFGILSWLNVMDFGVLSKRVREFVNCGNSLVLVNSFWGFEKPQYLLHPNIVPVGTIAKPLSKAPDFSESHPELHSFLKTARVNHRKIFLVTTGSMVQMEEWMVKLLWEAFERLSREHYTSTVWSLREECQEFLSQEQLQHPAFHFSKWLPQPALMASDLVDGVLTHCGWNGTLECVTGGKPMVVLPFFGDQMANAVLLRKAGCATAVTTNFPFPQDDTSGRSSYAGPDAGLWKRLRLCILTVNQVVEGCAKILKDPSYKAAAQRLKALSTGPGMGSGFASELIEHAGKHGLRHLTESGGGSGIEDGPRAATFANRLTGHRPLAITMAICAFAMAGAVGAVNMAKSATRTHG